MVVIRDDLINTLVGAVLQERAAKFGRPVEDFDTTQLREILEMGFGLALPLVGALAATYPIPEAYPRAWDTPHGRGASLKAWLTAVGEGRV